MLCDSHCVSALALVLVLTAWSIPMNAASIADFRPKGIPLNRTPWSQYAISN
jgi:hypothetical protein